MRIGTAESVRLPVLCHSSLINISYLVISPPFRDSISLRCCKLCLTCLFFLNVWQGELSIEEKDSLLSFFKPTWKTGTCKLTRGSLSFIDKTNHETYDLKDLAGQLFLTFLR